MAKKLTEKQIEKTYEIKIGFDTPKGRFDVGTDKPNFVNKSEFSESELKELLELGALVAVETLVKLAENETIVFEKIGE